MDAYFIVWIIIESVLLLRLFLAYWKLLQTGHFFHLDIPIFASFKKTFFKNCFVAGEMAQWLGTLAALAEYPALIPSAYVMAGTLFWCLHRHMQAKHPCTKDKNKV